MFRKTLAALTLTAVAATTAAVFTVLSKKDKEEEDDEVHFINIDDVAEEIEEEVEKEVEQEVSEEVKEISSIYPYLSTEFIAEQFARNDVFNREYPEDTLITIAHKVCFKDEDMGNEFCRIASENGYEIEVLNDEEALIKKQMYAVNGSILSDIYNVANQVNCLSGIYEGYKID